MTEHEHEIQNLRERIKALEQDNTKLAKVLEMLRESEERLSLALDGTGLGLWDWNLETGELIHNTLWGEMLGYEPGEIEPGPEFWEGLLHPDDKDECFRTLQMHLDGKTPVYEAQYRLKTKKDGWMWILDRGKIVERNSKGQPIRATGTHRDITREKEYEFKLAHLAHHDPLTGLSNRRNMEIQFKAYKARARRHNRKLALLVMDLDGYKAVNDEFGHKIGDLLLKILAYRFEKVARVDELVVRLGGDEFGVLVPEYKRRASLEGLAKRILKIFSAPFEIEGKTVNVGCSIGISLFPEHADSIDGLLAKADKAMYEVKWSTKNNYKIAEVLENVTG